MNSKNFIREKAITEGFIELQISIAEKLKSIL